MAGTVWPGTAIASPRTLKIPSWSSFRWGSPASSWSARTGAAGRGPFALAEATFSSPVGGSSGSGSTPSPRWPKRGPASVSPSVTAWCGRATGSRTMREPWKRKRRARALRGFVEAGGRRPLQHPGDQVGVGPAPGTADRHVDAVGVEPLAIGRGKSLPFGHGAVPDLPAPGADELVVGGDPRAVGAVVG